MIVIRTTEYYKPHFGTIIPDMKSVGYSDDKEVFEYIFNHKNFLYEWLNITKLKIKGGGIYKGSTLIGAYEWYEDERSKPRPDSNKNTKKQRKPKQKKRKQGS